MNRSPRTSPRAVLDRYGTTFAEDAGIRLTDEPAPLFQLLVLAQLLSARIGAGIAVATAAELRARRLDDAAAHARREPAAAWSPALGRGGYRRYDERTATQLREMAALVLDRYGGDLRRLADAGGRGRRPGGAADPGGQGHRPDRRRRLPARGPGACGPGCARTSTSGRAPVPGGSACPTTTRPARRAGRAATTWPGSPPGWSAISRLPAGAGSARRVTRLW